MKDNLINMLHSTNLINLKLGIELCLSQEELVVWGVETFLTSKNREKSTDMLLYGRLMYYAPNPTKPLVTIHPEWCVFHNNGKEELPWCIIPTSLVQEGYYYPCHLFLTMLHARCVEIQNEEP